MEIQNQLIEHLKGKTNGKLVMTPKQLAEEIPISPKQQSKLREENKFPIPHQNIGRSVYYSIFHIADFLLTGSVHQSAEPEDKPKKEKSTPEKISHPSSSVNLSHLFLLRAFAGNLFAQAEEITNLAENILKYQKSAEMVEQFSEKFKPKGDTKSLEENDGKI
ncbi:hypothetical protein H8K32_14430 [Undibacterium jejuense]|uniref:Uncharacterized protein n=1 Tax=Undibacterium jejuense TaxID=1344949 RepID=A0A923HJE2_9BURK|nr:hypothetical protein [Undibacterium jejuense]MBC3863300.1 hypothetical protein [Undibacterium jejuense]